MAKFNVTVTEILKRCIVVEADNSEEAYERVEELCEKETVDLNTSDFESRSIEVNDEATDVDESYFEVYDKYWFED